MPSSLQFACPHCIERLQAEFNQIGRELICEHCREELMVPIPGDRFAIKVGTVYPPCLRSTGSGLCPHCHKDVKIQIAFHGKDVSCRSCEGKFSITEDGLPMDDSYSRLVDSLLTQLKKMPLTPSHVHHIDQLGKLPDVRCVEYLCRLLFSLKRDQPRHLAVDQPWVRQRLDAAALEIISQWREEYAAKCEPMFLNLSIDPSFPLLKKEEFLYDFEVHVVEALTEIGDPRCHPALRRKLQSVIEYRAHHANDPQSPFNLRFESARDQEIFDRLSGFVGMRNP